ncbi:MAG: hypothetical protein IV090_13650 [Candidatus Sericytochromatia bacterium]|nr:hypothetical protein [Candidatus Sericytochromatia bacterium]
MKSGFSKAEQENIYRAKAILKQLWKDSGLNQASVIEALAARGLETNQSSLATWLSSKEGNYYRPKQEFVKPLLEIFCPPEQIETTFDEVITLLGYLEGPWTPEMVKNRVAHQLNTHLETTLKHNQSHLRSHLEALDGLLDEIEPLILDYDKGYPTIFIEKDNRPLLWQLLGKDKDLHKAYQVEEGYEVPFSQIRSQETITQIINNLNEGIRLLQAYVDRHITEEEEGFLLFDFYRIEDFVTYAWEIADRLLNNNALCKAVPVLKRTLLRTMTVAWGVHYILENQTRDLSEIQFQNVLKLKGSEAQADVHCSVAVYTGMLARQYLRSVSPDRARQGLKLFDKAETQLRSYHSKVLTSQDHYFYKKELANLYYDVANYLLNHQHHLPEAQKRFQTAMAAANAHYAEVLDTPNVFVQGLSFLRALHIQIFYMISSAWVESKPKNAIKLINLLNDGQMLDEQFWKIQIAKAIAFAVLSLKTDKAEEKAQFKAMAQEALDRSRLVEGFGEKTQREIQAEYALHQLFATD